MKNEISKSYFNKLKKQGNEITTMINFGTKKTVLDKKGNEKLYVRNFNRFGIEGFQSIKE
jgi:hypothetical protein